MRAADLKSYAPEWATPISTTYRGATVQVMPPNSFGLLLLLQLNGLAGLDPAALDNDATDRFIHLMAATRLAFAHGEPEICDPRVRAAPLERLLGAEMTRLLQEGTRGGPPGRTAFPTGGTSTLSVVDADGNALTFVQSVFDPFGAYVLDPETGLILNNRMSRFSTDPRHANVVAPGKRPAHTLNPVHVTVDGRPRWLLATPGAHNQTISIAQIVSNLVDRRMDLAAAVEAPRWTMEFGGPGVFLEDGIAESVMTDLVARGYAARRNASQFFGSAETIELTPGGALYGVADPRRDAYAAGW
jgi:gamma-glutamyltranspeptidase/glutathione hydrolase